ncbi:PREDICTED: TNF receptor-associated factor 6-like [Dufourea novaeangliae]|uniref:TNF receptor-associated factor 6-like n=1 Tax=Dufourea novaeangliae TaxID=178035 RepID=UPI000767387C|nr:PREDICTED: TNF receptor-associated factor 6-like [Dufourea novaeangliae]
MTSYVLLFLYLNTLYLTCCVASVRSAPKLSMADTNVTSDDGVTETQHATCKIATEELVASARSTVTRVLTGACNAKAIDEKLRALEMNLTQELDEIKTILHAILENKRDTFKLTETSDKNNLRRYYRDGDPKGGTRSSGQHEIDTFNDTVQEVSSVNGSSNLFVYQWQIKNFDEKLESWETARSERSPTFYAGQSGYGMYMKMTPRYFPDGTVFMAVGLTRGRYDSILKWPFPCKIRLEVLDQSNEQPRQDRRSRIWDPSTLCSEYFWGRPKLTGKPDNPECVGLSVPRQVVFAKLPVPSGRSTRNTRYLSNGTITVQLTVYH